MEILLTIFAYKLLFPKFVFLNRGNHESRGQNSWMGFEDEVLHKYHSPDDPVQARRFYEQLEDCFDVLPLCAIIQEKVRPLPATAPRPSLIPLAAQVFVCHGGLFQRSGITMNHIRAIKRKREAPIDGKSFEDRLYEELLWSDPRPTANYPQPLVGVRRSDRGAGVEFGPDVTNDFCQSNGIALVVRSHECVQEGYEVRAAAARWRRPGRPPPPHSPRHPATIGAAGAARRSPHHHLLRLPLLRDPDQQGCLHHVRRRPAARNPAILRPQHCQQRLWRHRGGASGRRGGGRGGEAGAEARGRCSADDY